MFIINRLQKRDGIGTYLKNRGGPTNEKNAPPPQFTFIIISYLKHVSYLPVRLHMHGPGCHRNVHCVYLPGQRTMEVPKIQYKQFVLAPHDF